MINEKRGTLRYILGYAVLVCFFLFCPGYANADDGPISSSIEGGRGLLYMQTARTIGMGAIDIGFKGLYLQKETYVPGMSGLVIANDDVFLAGFPVTFGLTNEVDITAAVYGYGNGRQLLNTSDVTEGWSESRNALGAARFGIKIRLPFNEESPIQIAGKFGAIIDTGKYQLDGMNYRWTRTDTDIEASLLETFDLHPSFSLTFEQGYILSGSEYSDDQIVGAAGMQYRIKNIAALNIETVARMFRGKGLSSALNAGADASLYSNPAGVGNIRYLMDTALDYDRDFLVVAPSVAVRLTSHITLDAGAIINLADHADPKENIQAVFGITFTGGFASMTDSDHDGVNNRGDMEHDTPLGYPVDMHGVSLDTDHDGVPDGIDQEVDTMTGARVNSRGVAMDTDGDGVYDGLDMEPETQRGMAVDVRGITLDGDRDGVSDGVDREPNTPYGAIVDPVGVSIDSDGDTVPDGIDLEPETIMGAVVNPQGVALDGDSDGVPDGIDLEPSTPRGITVDTAGRAVVRQEYSLLSEGMIRLNTIAFASASSIISSDSYTVLDEIGQLLKKYPLLRIQIGGHTDSVGDKALNYRLSRERALAVREYLLNTFPEIAADRLQAVGYGSDKPVTTNATPEGRRQNRRVEFIVINRDELITIEE